MFFNRCSVHAPTQSCEWVHKHPRDSPALSRALVEENGRVGAVTVDVVVKAETETAENPLPSDLLGDGNGEPPLEAGSPSLAVRS